MLRGSLRLFSGAAARLPSLCFDEGERKLRSAVARNLREFTIERFLRTGQPFRVTLHPNDVHDAAAWRQVERVMARLRDGGWTPLGLDEAISRMQAASSAGAKHAAAAS
jgi:hypothetical protein